MQRVEKLPPAFKRLRKIGGVVEFAVFDDSRGTEDEIIAAIGSAIPRGGTFDARKLRVLGNRRIRERRFFGDWYDLDSGALIKVGNWGTASGEKLHNPKLKTLDQVKIMSGAFSPPDPGSGGQFAYAFTTTPYPLRARPSEVQRLFDEIRKFIVPPTLASEILDWSSPSLPEVSSCFAAGMEWWGVFLFSIHVPDLHQLTVAMASTSD